MKIQYIIFTSIMLFIIACASKQKTNEVEVSNNQEELIKRGKLVAQGTFNSLSQELKKSMASGGIEEAIAYCNVNALPITDSLSEKYNAIIKRTSAKYRNPKNAPSMAEGKVLLDYQALKDKGEDMKPILVEVGGKHIFYAPIVMQEMCQKCHGAKNEIQKYEEILSKYPGDLATGYKTGDLRGMWSVVLLPSNK